MFVIDAKGIVASPAESTTSPRPTPPT